jgi:hypothetical protein
MLQIKMKNIFIKSLIIIVLVFFLSTIYTQGQGSKKWTPKEGFVPNATTAIEVSKAILIPIYGDQIKEQMPFKADLIGDSVWIVKGTQKKIALAGVAYIEIRKSDCKILKVTHGK